MSQNTTSIVIIGGRGNGTVMASAVEDCQSAGQPVSCAGFLNDSEEKEIDGYPVLGKVQDMSWNELPSHTKFLYALNNAKKAKERFDLLQSLNIPDERFAQIVHPTAVVSSKARLDQGVVVMPLCVVGPGARVGAHSVLYAQSMVGHDSHLAEMVFVANNASIGAHVKIEQGVHLGSNCSILERVELGPFSLVGIGAVVLKNVPAFGKAVGNPARLIGSLSTAP